MFIVDISGCGVPELVFACKTFKEPLNMGIIYIYIHIMYVCKLFFEMLFELETDIQDFVPDLRAILAALSPVHMVSWLARILCWIKFILKCHVLQRRHICITFHLKKRQSATSPGKQLDQG